jgi:hypothetical protein
MQSAGGGISSARDVDRWMRAVFGGKIVPPKQQQEWTELVSIKTGESIATVSADDPAGFTLGLAYKILGPLGAQWFYEGKSLGKFRVLLIVDELTERFGTTVVRRDNDLTKSSGTGLHLKLSLREATSKVRAQQPAERLRIPGASNQNEQARRRRRQIIPCPPPRSRSDY